MCDMQRPALEEKRRAAAVIGGDGRQRRYDFTGIRPAAVPLPMSDTADTALLDAARADFITHHVSILVGSCNARCEPAVVRAFGCRVAPDRRSVTVFLAVPHSTAVLADLRAGGGIAVVFSRPTTHETVQLKGMTARIEPLAEGDRELMRVYGRSFAEEIGTIGFEDPFRQAIMAGIEGEVVAVTFVPSAAFEQTPGPAAGQPLAARS